MSSVVSIGDKTYRGNNIVVTNGKVFIDGKEADTSDQKTINITVEGNVETLKVDSCESVTVTGNAGSVQTSSGMVKIDGHVNGSVQTMSGSVKCGPVSGNINTMSGDIEHG